MTKAMTTNIKDEKNSEDILNELLKLCEPPTIDAFQKRLTRSICSSILVALVTGEVKSITITPDFSKEEGVMKGLAAKLDAEKELLAISAMPLEEVYAKLIPQLCANLRHDCLPLPLEFGGVFARMMEEAARDLMESEDAETEDAPSEDKPPEQSAA